MVDTGVNLLVSVRSAKEALAALAGGAALIDVKEPARGPLGRADEDVMREVVAIVARRRPVSAALGEWADDDAAIPDCGLSYVKWGLAGCRRLPDWRCNLAKLLARKKSPRLVLAAYADWQCALAPSMDEVFSLAVDYPGCVVLIDTYCKDAQNPLHKVRPTLLDWLSVAGVEDLCGRAREARIKIALAGSLGAAEISALLPARPNWFAVRGAVCADGDRHGRVDAERVRQLVAILQESAPRAAHAS